MTFLRGTARTVYGGALRARYENGDTIRDLKAATGRSYGYLHRLLVEAGTTLRPRGRRST